MGLGIHIDQKVSFCRKEFSNNASFPETLDQVNIQKEKTTDSQLFVDIKKYEKYLAVITDLQKNFIDI